MPPDTAPTLVPNRHCGDCNACCRYLKIDEPKLKKLPNVLCVHWDGGCTIYAERPDACRGFFCGWRILPHLSEDWRPDRSNILLRFTATDVGRRDVDINLLGPIGDAVQRELLEYIAARIELGFATFLVTPGPPGHYARKLLLNNRLAHASRSRSYHLALEAFDEAVGVCQALPTKPVDDVPVG